MIISMNEPERSKYSITVNKLPLYSLGTRDCRLKWQSVLYFFFWGGGGGEWARSAFYSLNIIVNQSINQSINQINLQKLNPSNKILKN